MGLDIFFLDFFYQDSAVKLELVVFIHYRWLPLSCSHKIWTRDGALPETNVATHTHILQVSHADL